MKTLFFAFGALSLSAGAFAQYWSTDNLVVVRVGTGASALTNSATAVFLDQYTQAAGSARVNSYGYATSGVNALTLAGTSLDEGQLSNGAVLSGGIMRANFVLQGYNTAVGTNTVANTGVNRTSTITASTNSPATVVPRVISRINSAGATVNEVQTKLGTYFDAVPARSAVYDGTSLYAGSGARDGLVRFDTEGSSTGTIVESLVINTRATAISGNDLYFSTTAGTPGIFKVPNAKTATNSVPPVAVYTNPLASLAIYDFELLSNNELIYSDINTGLWFVNGSGTATNISTTPIRAFVRRGFQIFATTTEASANRIIKLDFGSSWTSGVQAGTTLQTAAANTAFRGIEAVPEPTTITAVCLGLAALARRKKRI